ncbi:MAG TPA: hypothetical protein VFJ01_10665 [Oleiagrimonas sp.]|nr:hypothetical protein [Oleiagrimonas sp.]
MLWDAWPQLQANLPHIHARWLLLTLVGDVVAGYLGFEAFRTLFEHMRPRLYSRLQLGNLYFIGQLMKHLPGRIWGVAYQSASGDRASLAQWVSVSAVYMLASTGFALWVALTVLGFMLRWDWGALALVVGGVVYALGWRPRPLIALLNLLRKLPLRVMARLCDALQPFAHVNARFKLRLGCWFVASWLLYLLAWAGYGLVWPDLTAADGVWLCAIYTVAWFVGYASVLSPSGIGVRELVFVLLARDFPPDAVAGMAVLGRVMLLAVDVLLGVVVAPLGSRVFKQNRGDS